MMIFQTPSNRCWTQNKYHIAKRVIHSLFYENHSGWKCILFNRKNLPLTLKIYCRYNIDKTYLRMRYKMTMNLQVKPYLKWQRNKFFYNAKIPPLLENLSLNLKKGKRYAKSNGTSGSVKSTDSKHYQGFTHTSTVRVIKKAKTLVESYTKSKLC